jgi:SAM-dependent methyltransferase
MAASSIGNESRRRFRSAVGHYLADRPAYADLLIRRVADLVRLGPQDAVLDLGCGPGVLARAFAPLAGGAVALFHTGHSVFAADAVDAPRLVDRAFSMAGTAPARLGARAAALERDIVALVRDEAPDGRLTEVIESSALVARRPGEEVAQ